MSTLMLNVLLIGLYPKELSIFLTTIVLDITAHWLQMYRYVVSAFMQNDNVASFFASSASVFLLFLHSTIVLSFVHWILRSYFSY